MWRAMESAQKGTILQARSPSQRGSLAKPQARMVGSSLCKRIAVGKVRPWGHKHRDRS